MHSLADRLRLTLRAAGISQSALAQVSGLNITHINDICRGRRVNVNVRSLIALADTLGCTVDWLLGRTEPGPLPAAVRQAIGQRGGTVLQYVGDERMDPININAGVTSRRGRVGRGIRPPPREE